MHAEQEHKLFQVYFLIYSLKSRRLMLQPKLQQVKLLLEELLAAAPRYTVQ